MHQLPHPLEMFHIRDIGWCAAGWAFARRYDIRLAATAVRLPASSTLPTRISIHVRITLVVQADWARMRTRHHLQLPLLHLRHHHLVPPLQHRRRRHLHLFRRPLSLPATLLISNPNPFDFLLQYVRCLQPLHFFVAPGALQYTQTLRRSSGLRSRPPEGVRGRVAGRSSLLLYSAIKMRWEPLPGGIPNRSLTPLGHCVRETSLLRFNHLFQINFISQPVKIESPAQTWTLSPTSSHMQQYHKP